MLKSLFTKKFVFDLRCYELNCNFSDPISISSEKEIMTKVFVGHYIFGGCKKLFDVHVFYPHGISERFFDYGSKIHCTQNAKLVSWKIRGKKLIVRVKK